jgi:general secretion pathway protein D
VFIFFSGDGLRISSRVVAVLLAGILAVSAAAESAKSLYNQGKKAEARQDYIAAYEAYAKAYQEKSTDLRYRISFERMRFFAAAAHVKNGQKLRDDGKLPEALAEFQTAVKIDPSSFIAQQEAKRTQGLIDAANGMPGQDKQINPPSQLTKRLDEAAGPIDLAPVSQAPITLEIANDSKMVYETIGKLAGVNVLFDPDYTSRRIVLKLNGVSLQEALDIVAFNSNTFWRPVTQNTIYIAANTPAKRKEIEQNVLKTFYLSNLTQATELQDVTNVLRSVLDITKVQQVNSQNAIIVRATPDQVALAEKIIGDMDKAKPEVIVEVAIMQVRRDKLRDLGVNPPTSGSIALQPPTTTTTTTGTTGTTTTPTTTTGTNNGINLNNLASLRASDFLVTIPAATATFMFNNSDSKLIQNPQIRSSDNVKASLKIGDRVPIATGSFGSGFAGAGLAGANGLVNTQFQYIDVGVNIDITPHVLSNREVALKLALDVSSVTGSTTIGGITQPIISQRKIEHDIRLKEGEVNLLGGIFEDQDSKTLSGIPGLGQLPFLKYLFATEHKDRVENEIVFILVPHIVRGQELTELNQKAIDVGTASYLDLRRVSHPQATPPATAAPQQPVTVPQQQQQQGAPGVQINPNQQFAPPTTAPNAAPNAGAPSQTPPQTAQNVPPSMSPSPGVGQQDQARGAPQQQPPTGPASIFFDPATLTPSVGGTFSVNVVVRNAADVYSAPMQISYDPKTLQVLNVSNGDLLSRDGQAVALVHREDVEHGTIQLNATRPPGSGGISGDGVLYVITFQAKYKGDSQLAIPRPNARNSQQQSIPMNSSPASVSVK